MTMKRIALYARVSAGNSRRDVETQLLRLRDYARNRGLEIEGEYIDWGGNDKRNRTALNRLVKAARLRKYDAVVVARFDSFARSTRHLLSTIAEFEALGIHFISLAESVDTSTPVGKTIFAVLGAAAELERTLIIERIISGLDRARKKGNSPGRPGKVFDNENDLNISDRVDHRA